MFTFRKTFLALLSAAFFSLATAREAQALPLNSGDVFAAVDGGLGSVKHYNSSHVLLETLNTGASGFTTGMAFDSAGNLYVTHFSAGKVYRFAQATGALMEAGGFVNITAIAGVGGQDPESIVFDAAGNFYVGTADGNRDIYKFNAAGTHLATFNVATGPRGSDWIDLAADQKTMFYTSEGGIIRRFDVSTNTQLADFANVGGVSYALRLLGDGGLLVAHTSNILRLNAAGAVIQIYDDPSVSNNWFALNLAPDGTSFYSGDVTSNANFYKFDIATGAILAKKSTAPAGTLAGLAVAGELTQAVPVVPEPGTLVMAGMGIAGLMGYSWRRRRQRAIAG